MFDDLPKPLFVAMIVIVLLVLLLLFVAMIVLLLIIVIVIVLLVCFFFQLCVPLLPSHLSNLREPQKSSLFWSIRRFVKVDQNYYTSSEAANYKLKSHIGQSLLKLWDVFKFRHCHQPQKLRKVRKLRSLWFGVLWQILGFTIVSNSHSIKDRISQE